MHVSRICSGFLPVHHPHLAQLTYNLKHRLDLLPSYRSDNQDGYQPDGMNNDTSSGKLTILETSTNLFPCLPEKEKK